MSLIRRNLYRGRLAGLLARADDEEFFIMVWATLAIQSGREKEASRFLSYPRAAASGDITSKYAIHAWKLETLLNEILTTPKLVLQHGRRNRRLDCRRFEAIARATNALAGLENAEDGLTLMRVNVLREMHRLGQRQFEWQRGFLSYSQLYRAVFIYGGDQTKAFFAQANGFAIDEFVLVCIVLRVLFLTRPIFLRPGNLEFLGISDDLLGRVLDLITIPHASARMRASKLRSGSSHTGYKRSLFRECPCIAFGGKGERVHAPLPDLLVLRATSGIFYDVVNGGDRVRNEISSRFEAYCVEFLQSMLPSHAVNGSYKYAS